MFRGIDSALNFAVNHNFWHSDVADYPPVGTDGHGRASRISARRAAQYAIDNELTCERYIADEFRVIRNKCDFFFGHAV